jgi:hypothetical protein
MTKRERDNQIESLLQAVRELVAINSEYVQRLTRIELELGILPEGLNESSPPGGRKNVLRLVGSTGGQREGE